MSSRRSVADALAWFSTLDDKLTPTQSEIARAILKEINERLGFLHNVGLDYLNLDRTSGTLSGGESQRIRLASQIGSGLSGVLYVLDEPSIGLHQKDNDRLLETLQRLKGLGNTVLVVEHDEDCDPLRRPCHRHGPRRRRPRRRDRLRRARLDDLLACETSLTADYLSGRRAIPHPRHPPQGQWQEAHRPRRPREQPAGRHRRLPARHLHLRHRRLRLGQVEPDHRHALRRRRALAERRPHPRRQARQASPASSISTRSSTSTSRRSAAPRAPTRRPTPAPSPRSATGSPACRKARRAATSPAASASTSRAAAARPARATAC